MVFNSFAFLIFYPIVLLLYFALPKKLSWIMLLLASYYFYISWNVELIYLIVFPALAYVFRSFLIRIFIGDGGPEVLAYTEQYLRWMCPTMWLLSFLRLFIISG